MWTSALSHHQGQEWGTANQPPDPEGLILACFTGGEVIHGLGPCWPLFLSNAYCIEETLLTWNLIVQQSWYASPPFEDLNLFFGMCVECGRCFGATSLIVPSLPKHIWGLLSGFVCVQTLSQCNPLSPWRGRDRHSDKCSCAVGQTRCAFFSLTNLNIEICRVSVWIKVL